MNPVLASDAVGILMQPGGYMPRPDVRGSDAGLNQNSMACRLKPSCARLTLWLHAQVRLHADRPPRVLTILGTRPEAVKLAPIIHELKRRGTQIHSRICITAQHRDMLDQVLRLFKIEADYDLDFMAANQTPTQAAAVPAKLVGH